MPFDQRVTSAPPPSGTSPPAPRTSSRDPRPGLSGLSPAELAGWFDEHGEPRYRVRQVSDALWRAMAGSADELRTLPSPLRYELERDFRLDTMSSTDLRLGDGSQTEKALHTLSDGALVESVLMHYPARPGRRERHTLCISSQAGCAVGCPFCATGELGFTRDLEAAEIIDQVRHAARRLAADGRRLTNVVFMGMGEPLLNLDQVIAAVQALSDPRRFGLGTRPGRRVPCPRSSASRARSRRRGSRRPSAATAGRRSEQRAVSWRPSMPASRPVRSLPDGGSVSSPKVPGHSVGSEARSRCRPG